MKVKTKMTHPLSYALIVGMLCVGICGCSASTESEDTAAQADKTLVVKGLYMRMPGDEALKACQKMVSSSKDLAVVDFRKGIEREKDEATKAAEKAEWEKNIKVAESDVDWFLEWHHINSTYVYDPKADACRGQGDHSFLKYVHNAKISGIGGTDEMAALAELHGYQVEWMLPGKRVIAAPKTNDKPKLFILPNGSRKEIEKKLAADGLQIVKSDRSSAYEFTRLALEDVNGNPIEKEVLVKEFIKLMYPKFASGYHSEKAQLVRQYKRERNPGLKRPIEYEMRELDKKEKYEKKTIPALAEKSVDGLLTWVESYNRKPHAMDLSEPKFISKKTIELSKLEGRLGQWRLISVDIDAVRKELANKCNLKVERAVLTKPIEKKPVEKIEEISGMVENPNGEILRNMHHDFNNSNGPWKKVLDEKGLVGVHSPLWFRLVLKTTNGVEVAKEEVVKNWLAARGQNPPDGKMRIAPNNLIRIAVREDGVNEDKWKSACDVWIDEEGKVYHVNFRERGISMLFNAGDLSSEEFAHALVEKYSGIPSLNLEVEKKDPGRGTIQECTWTYKCPKGYQVKLFERSYFNNSGVKYNSKMLERDVEVNLGLGLAGLSPDRYLQIFTIKPESARKFD